MKPKRIILIRHGQSEVVTPGIHDAKPDYAFNLTPIGLEQAADAGFKLKALVGDEPVFFYRSPFYRTRQTHERIAQYFPGSHFYEDPRLREQERTLKLATKIAAETEQERDNYSHFYYRYHGGESCADVFDRVSSFMSTLFRDFEKQDFPDNAVIICHGMTMRVFLMRFLHMSVEEFEFLSNPENCGFYVLQQDQLSGKYSLTEAPKRYAERNCKF